MVSEPPGTSVPSAETSVDSKGFLSPGSSGYYSDLAIFIGSSRAFSLPLYAKLTPEHHYNMTSSNAVIRTAFTFSRLWSGSAAALVTATANSQRHPAARDGEAAGNTRQDKENTGPPSSTEGGSDRSRHAGRQQGSRRSGVSRSNHSGSSGSQSTQTRPRQKSWWHSLRRRFNFRNKSSPTGSSTSATSANSSPSMSGSGSHIQSASWRRFIPFIGYHHVLMMIASTGIILFGENPCITMSDAADGLSSIT